MASLRNQPEGPAEALDLRQLAGVPRFSQSLVLAQLLAGRFCAQGEPAPKAVLHVCVNDRGLEALANALPFFAPDAEVLRFPAWDCLPYDRSSPQPALMATRMETLATLASGPSLRPRIILTTANAIIQRLSPKNAMKQVAVSLRKGSKIAREELIEQLVAQGYRRVGKAMEPGEFALRGSIIDIMPPSAKEGIRVDLFGDEIETIRTYEPLSQLTQGHVDAVGLYPVSEVLLSEEAIAHFREQYREQFGAVTKDDPLYEAISQGHSYPGMEHWLPLFYESTSTLLDYCAPGTCVTLDSEAPIAVVERHESIMDYYQARKAALKSSNTKNSFASGAAYHPVAPDDGFLMPAAWELFLQKTDALLLSPFMPEHEFNEERFDIAGYKPVLRMMQGQPGRTPFDQLREQIASNRERGKATLLACYTGGSMERLQTMIAERTRETPIHTVHIKSWAEVKSLKGQALGIAVLPLEAGFEASDAVVFSEPDILGERIQRSARKKKSDVFLQEAANFEVGELVVHKEHGIGRFEGLVTLEVSGAAHDCLKLVYDGDDKLFIPVENIELVTRFGLDEEDVKLDKLGGVAWQNRKARLKNRITMAAEGMLKIAAERLLKSGTVLDTPTGTYDDFSERFPYAETEDQERAIADILEDLHGGRPMDRLVCGDVGFGKTEVAMRAAFVASMNHHHRMQVAVITPTTLLARQHYYNFVERFEGFPVEIRQLSRMVPAKQQAETRAKLKEGTVDIVVGTHALLAKSVEFSRLGLVIVDEEQRFGVAQKEKLKELKSDVHVLTLSATPIPRTLQMALTGVRDLSLITTPPVDRLAIRSFVMPFDPVVLREAILRELHRGGKTFVVTPRIKYMAELQQTIAALVPEVKIAAVHGQMAPADIEKLMNDFYDGRYDVLISTAIIESGLDVPTANTMIVHNAHLFGLSQLYQLRGRVGRGKIRAYAYFLLPHHKVITRQATRRLEVMQTLDTLGAGFTLASHDMDIRGFGNLVGEEQSGHIKEVGVELYQQMLEEAVANLKADHAHTGQPAPEDWTPQINLGLAVLIPETYVEDLQLRLGLYRRVADLKTGEDIDSFAAELTDRFGPLPEEVQHLIAVLSIKRLCKQAGIDRIDLGPKGAVIGFYEQRFASPEKLLDHIARHPRTLKLRPDQKLVFTHEWKGAPEEKIGIIKELVGKMIALATATTA